MSILLESMSLISGTLGAAMPISLRRPYNSDTAPDMPAEMPASLTAIPDTAGTMHLQAPKACAWLKDVNNMVLEAKANGYFGFPALSQQQLDDHFIELTEKQDEQETQQQATTQVNA